MSAKPQLESDGILAQFVEDMRRAWLSAPPVQEAVRRSSTLKLSERIKYRSGDLQRSVFRHMINALLFRFV